MPLIFKTGRSVRKYYSISPVQVLRRIGLLFCKSCIYKHTHTHLSAACLLPLHHLRREAKFHQTRGRDGRRRESEQTHVKTLTRVMEAPLSSLAEKAYLSGARGSCTCCRQSCWTQLVEDASGVNERGGSEP